MNWWQTALISIGISLFTAVISFFFVNIHNKYGKLKFYITREFLSEKHLHYALTIYNPSNIPKLFQCLQMSFCGSKKQILGTQFLETSSNERRNSLGEKQAYLVEPTLVEPKKIEYLVVDCKVINPKETYYLYITYKDKKNKCRKYKIKHFKNAIANETTGGKINF